MRSAPHSGIAAHVLAARVKRLEDPRLLTGQASYVDDIHLPGLLHAAFVRSPHAHAHLSGVDEECGTQVSAYLPIRRSTGSMFGTVWP